MSGKIKVPLLDLKAQYALIKDEVRAAMDEVLESQVFILGPKVEELERNIAAAAGTKFGVGVSSGTDAQLVSLMALDVRPGDEVVTTPFTFFSTAGVIFRLRARPVFVDIDPVTFNIDPVAVAKALRKKTRAVVPVHLFGQCVDMDPLLKATNAGEVPVVEDAAQSIGAEYKGRRAGSMGRCGFFSFFPSKNLGAFGDAGMVVTSDEALLERTKLLRVHGSYQRYYHKEVGGNFRLDALQAAVLNVKLKHLDAWSRKRRENAAFYTRKLEESGLVESGYVAPPRAVYEAGGDANPHIFNQYTLRVKDRDGLLAFLREKTVGAEVYYPVPLHLQECFRELGYKKGDLPAAEEAAGSVLSLPIYPELTDEQKEYVVDTIVSFYS